MDVGHAHLLICQTDLSCCLMRTISAIHFVPRIRLGFLDVYFDIAKNMLANVSQQKIACCGSYARKLHFCRVTP